MSIITLTTDFGRLDYRVASIKGAIFSLKKEIQVVDITHEIEAHNHFQTAFVLKNAYHHFPKGSIHIISVDSFQHKEKKCLVFYANEHYFIVSDNGIFSLLFEDIRPEAVYEITLNNRFDDVVNFTTTDVFVPVAVHLENGGVPEIIGRKIDSYKELYFPKPLYNDAQKILSGEVIYIDHYGNVISNITKSLFEKYMAAHTHYEMKFRNISIKKISKYHTDIVKDWSKENKHHGEKLALFNDIDLLEIAMYKGSLNNGASSLMGLEIGEKIFIEFS